LGEDQVIKLLEEIRDLQKQHIEKYGEALRNQDASIQLQKQAVSRQKAVLIVLGIFLAVLLVFGILGSKL